MPGGVGGAESQDSPLSRFVESSGDDYFFSAISKPFLKASFEKIRLI